MNIQLLNKEEERQYKNKLKEQFGIERIDWKLIKSGKERVRALSANISKDELELLNNTVRIEVLGLYAFKEEGDIRITLDATHLLKDQIKKNIVEISEEQMKDWMSGQELNIPGHKGVIALKYPDGREKAQRIMIPMKK